MMYLTVLIKVSSGTAISFTIREIYNPSITDDSSQLDIEVYSTDASGNVLNQVTFNK